jgi:hypothetical protein
MAYNTIIRTQDYQASSFGEYGFRLVDNSFSQPSGEKYRVLFIIDDAVVTTTTTVGDALTAEPFQSGSYIYGKFDTVSVSSGAVIAYIGG